MHQDIENILVTESEIDEICTKLGKQITKDYQNNPPIVLGLLNGCVPFMSDLLKKVSLNVEILYMAVSSYHGGIQSSGDIKIKYDLSRPITGKDVLIVEDIVDTGATLNTVVELLKHRGASSVKVVTLLDKPEGRVVPFTADYVGKVIPKVFVVGYGLDYNEIYRNLPYVGILKPSVYQT